MNLVQKEINNSVPTFFLVTLIVSFSLDAYLGNMDGMRVVSYVLGIILNGVAWSMVKMGIDSEFKYVGFAHLVLFSFLFVIIKNELPFGFLNQYVLGFILKSPTLAVILICLSGLIILVALFLYSSRKSKV